MTDRPSPRRRSLGGLSMVLALSALSFSLSGCLTSSYSFISHGSGGSSIYVKVPAKWHTFDATQLVRAQNGPLSQTQINQIEAGQWLTTFSAAPHPTAKQLIVEGSAYPNGVIFAKQLTETDRDALSYAAMRAEILGQDPLNSPTGALNTSTSTPFNVLSYTEFTRPGGVRGSKLVTDISTNGIVETFAQIIAVDANTDWIYGVAVACKASCWGPNSGLINQVLNSWNIKEQS